MDELLQKLLEAEVLSEETKKELEEAFQGKLEEAMNEAKEKAAADVRAELTEQFIVERDRLVEAVDTKVAEFLESEITELKDDIESFRDLEAEYAEKLVESKAAMSVELKKDLTELVEKLDTFLEIRLSAELDELREDVAEIRKVEFGRSIFEAFRNEFINNYADEDSAEATLRETQERAAELAEALEESERTRAALERQIKLENVLTPLAGRQREVMEAILKNVDTDKLDEAYKTFIGRVIRESTDVAGSEKEDKVLAEGASKEDKKKAKATLNEKVKEAVVATGDGEEMVKESAMSDEQKAHLAHLRRLAGIK
jgi:hypothetical protein